MIFLVFASIAGSDSLAYPCVSFWIFLLPPLGVKSLSEICSVTFAHQDPRGPTQFGRPDARRNLVARGRFVGATAVLSGTTSLLAFFRFSHSWGQEERDCAERAKERRENVRMTIRNTHCAHKNFSWNAKRWVRRRDGASGARADVLESW